jgi:hypothetical protein
LYSGEIQEILASNGPPVGELRVKRTTVVKRLRGILMLNLVSHRSSDNEKPIHFDFYRIDITENLFGEYSVIREFGAAGRSKRQVVAWVSNLRDAAVAAERWQRLAHSRGFRLTTRSWSD